MALHARSFDVVIQRFYWLSGRSTRHTISDLGILSLRLNIPQSPTSSDYFQQLPHRKLFFIWPISSTSCQAKTTATKGMANACLEPLLPEVKAANQQAGVADSETIGQDSPTPTHTTNLNQPIKSCKGTSC